MSTGCQLFQDSTDNTNFCTDLLLLYVLNSVKLSCENVFAQIFCVLFCVEKIYNKRCTAVQSNST
jgi:hypothetical protein